MVPEFLTQSLEPVKPNVSLQASAAFCLNTHKPVLTRDLEVMDNRADVPPTAFQ